MEAVLIFVMGAVCGTSIYRGLTILLGAGQGILMFRQAEYMCLQLLALSLEDAANIKTTKQKIIEKLGHSENVIKLTRNEDAYNLSTWKREAINRLMERYPPSYKRVVHYRNWNEAMNYFEKQRKNICNSGE
jgi:ribosomal protein L17